MTQLFDLQRWMFDALLAPRAVMPSDVAAHLIPSEQLSSLEGLAIYQRSFGQRIANAMRAQFPALHYALGTALFDDFVAEYVRASPPDSYTLYDLGRGFPQYLVDSRPDSDQPPDTRETWINFIVDLAHFEYAVFVMFDAPGHEGNMLANPDTSDAVLRIQPAVTLGTYRFPVAAYYHCVRRAQNPQFPDAEDCYIALVRKDFITRTIVLTRPEHHFLSAMKLGSTVAEAIIKVACDVDIPLNNVQTAWPIARRRWIEYGLFTSDR